MANPRFAITLGDGIAPTPSWNVISIDATLLLAATQASALEIVVNNGLAPPNPANVIEDGTYATDYVFARNIGYGRRIHS
jgi:hypothetical protein